MKSNHDYFYFFGSRQPDREDVVMIVLYCCKRVPVPRWLYYDLSMSLSPSPRCGKEKTRSGSPPVPSCLYQARLCFRMHSRVSSIIIRLVCCGPLLLGSTAVLRCTIYGAHSIECRACEIDAVGSVVVATAIRVQQHSVNRIINITPCLHPRCLSSHRQPMPCTYLVGNHMHTIWRNSNQL